MPSIIKLERARLGVSQMELAHRLGVNVVTLRGWEKDIGSCKAANLLSLSDIFGVSVDYLLEKTEERTRA